ncbi:MAG: vitamin B12-dependent ribonucleotide reductase, partial [Planctomycetales bacterium]|nr:vitamin B12-dependent ribonucleotide reductase [Planctomycetales bacterium]
SQPLNTKSGEKEETTSENAVPRPRRERLSDTRQSLTHKFNVNGHEGYVTVGLYDDGRPGELFITMAKEGSTIGGLMDSFGTAISMSLQYGVPLEVLVNKFSHTRFEPMGYTTNPEIRIAKSLVDYIFRWLAMEFLPGYREATRGPQSETKKPSAKNRSAANGAATTSNGTASKPVANSKESTDSSRLQTAGLMMVDSPSSESGDARNGQFAKFQSDAPSCDNCGAITVRNGNCYLCHNCGNSMGCS